MSDLLFDITGEACAAPNPGGTETEITFIDEHGIENWPAFLAQLGAGDAGQGVTLDGNITLKAGYHMHKYPVTTYTGEIKDDLVGDIDSKSFTSSILFQMKTTDAVVLEHAAITANGCWVCLMKENSGQVRVVGRKGNPAKMSQIAATTGSGDNPKRFVAFTVESKNNATPAPVYTGTFVYEA